MGIETIIMISGDKNKLEPKEKVIGVALALLILLVVMFLITKVYLKK